MSNKKRLAVIRKLDETVWTPINTTKSSEAANVYKRYEAEMRSGSCRGYRVEKMTHETTKTVFYKSDYDLLMVEAEREISLCDHPPLKKIFDHKFFPISSWARAIPRGISWYKLGELVEIHEIEN
jgi:hypothetical protein